MSGCNYTGKQRTRSRYTVWLPPKSIAITVGIKSFIKIPKVYKQGMFKRNKCHLEAAIFLIKLTLMYQSLLSPCNFNHTVRSDMFSPGKVEILS